MKKSSNTKKNVRKAVIICAIALVVLTAGGAATYFFALMDKAYPVTDAIGLEQKLTVTELKAILEVQTFYPGITIKGIDMSGKTKTEAAAVFAGEPALEVNFALNVEGVEYPLDTSVIKITSDLPAIIDEAYNYNRTSTKASEAEALVERYGALIQLGKSTKNYDTKYTADTSAVDKAIHNILDPLESDAVDARATFFDVKTLSFTYEDSAAGFSVDIDTAIADVKAAVAAKEYVKVITVNTAIVVPKFSKDELSAKLGLVSTTTTQTTSDKNRNTNINLVCKTINGLVLQPGESFNFNEYVGKRIVEKGYKEAGGIFDGALRMELGGGICQANGTLFHSVMKADLRIDERHPHSWPSTYVDVGTDATVSWAGPNFQFTNDTEYPVAIHAYYADRKVTIQIFGRPVEDGMTIEIKGTMLSTTPPGAPEYVADPLSPVGKNTSIRSSHNKITAQCNKIYYKDGVEVKREMAFSSTYRAITVKISVGVLALDGTLCPMDPLTGAVIIPVPSPTVVPVETAPTAIIPTPSLSVQGDADATPAA